jgi:AcrR family transcriptional regulator
MELYGERGYESTTVVEIAERAGLTERTFFRHFADKREVLFSGAVAFREILVAKVDDAPASLPPIEVVTEAFGSLADELFEGRRDFVRQRQAIIDANAELQERELIKLASVASAMAGALRRRGVGDPMASLAAEAGMAVFKIAFEAWVRDAGGRSLSESIRLLADEMRDVTGDRTTATRR